MAAALHPAGAASRPRRRRAAARLPAAAARSRACPSVIEHVVERFGSLQKIMRATIDDLVDVEGVGEARARAIKDGLSRLAETSILDRYS